MSVHQRWNSGFSPALLIAVACIAAILCGSVMASGSSPLAPSMETLAGGAASPCSDFMNGFALGMGIGALFGCVWCIAGGLVAKGVSMFC